jgi:hypothetical protein
MDALTIQQNRSTWFASGGEPPMVGRHHCLQGQQSRINAEPSAIIKR